MVQSSSFFDAMAHPWEAPGESDERSPCVFLNSLANHGLINRNGTFVDLFDIVTKMEEVFSFSPEFIYLTKILPAIECGQTYKDVTGILRLDFQGLFAPECKDFRSILVRSPEDLAVVNQTLLDNLLANDTDKDSGATTGLNMNSEDILQNNTSVITLEVIALFQYNRILEVYNVTHKDPTFKVAGSDFITFETLSRGIIGTKPNSATVEKDRLSTFLRWERLPNQLLRTEHNFFDHYDPLYMFFLDIYLSFEDAMRLTFYANKDDHEEQNSNVEDIESHDENTFLPDDFLPPNNNFIDAVDIPFDDAWFSFDDSIQFDDASFSFDDSIQFDYASFSFDDSVHFNDAVSFFDDSIPPTIDDIMNFDDDNDTFPIADDDRYLFDDIIPFIDDNIASDDTYMTADDAELFDDDSIPLVNDTMIIDDNFLHIDDGFMVEDDESHDFPSPAASYHPIALPDQSSVPSETMTSQTESPVPTNMEVSAFPTDTGITDYPVETAIPTDTISVAAPMESDKTVVSIQPTTAASAEISIASNSPITNASENVTSTFFPTESTESAPPDTPTIDEFVINPFADLPTRTTAPSPTLISEPSLVVSGPESVGTLSPTGIDSPVPTVILSKDFSVEPSSYISDTPAPTDTTSVDISVAPSATLLLKNLGRSLKQIPPW